MLHIIAVITMIVGTCGFIATFIGAIDVMSQTNWGALAIGGMVVTIMTRRTSD